MKSVCTIFAMCLTTAMAFSQIKNTSISKRNLPQTAIAGISVQKLQQTSIKELNRMPTAKIDPAKLKIRPYTSWKITPNKLRDKDLYISAFFGEYSPRALTILPELKYSGGVFQAWTYLKLKFRAEEGAEYRVKIKLAPGQYFDSHRIMAMTNGTQAQKWRVDDANDEVLMVFRGKRNQEVWIGNMFDESSYQSANSINYLKPVPIKSISIDKIGG